ncbi:hypothetical protein [Photobacterium profundum]|nr:hypothetical protein [Photobacterium profundum]
MNTAGVIEEGNIVDYALSEVLDGVTGYELIEIEEHGFKRCIHRLNA